MKTFVLEEEGGALTVTDTISSFSFKIPTNSTFYSNPVSIYLFKVNNRNIRTRCEIYSKITIKTPEGCQWRHSGVFIVNSEHISHLVLMFLLLTLNMQLSTGKLP